MEPYPAPRPNSPEPLDGGIAVAKKKVKKAAKKAPKKAAKKKKAKK